MVFGLTGWTAGGCERDAVDGVTGFYKEGRGWAEGLGTVPGAWDEDEFWRENLESILGTGYERLLN